MKITPARAGIAVLALALAGAVWRYWENGREMEALREEAAQLRAAPQTRPRVAGPPTALVSAGDRSTRTSSAAARREDFTDAEFAKLPPDERAAFLQHWREQMELKRAAEEAARALEERNKGPQAASYAGGKATGPPDAAEHGGDSSSAWCPAPMSTAGEWLKLSYARPVEIKELAIHETYATGALSRVVALLPDGKERVLWEGTEPVEKPPVQRIVPVPAGVRSDQIRIELDTTRTNNWQEIDAVEMVGRDGSRQWAKEAEGSSYWGSGRG